MEKHGNKGAKSGIGGKGHKMNEGVKEAGHNGK